MESKWDGQLCLQQWRENKLECDLNEIRKPEAEIVTTANRTTGIKRQEKREKTTKTRITSESAECVYKRQLDANGQINNIRSCKWCESS